MSAASVSGADPVAPEWFVAEFSTSAGRFRIRTVRSWSPLGVDRLYRLVREGHYDDSRIYRVVPGWVAQFGYAGESERQRAQSIIADDPMGPARNLRGLISYSASYTADMGHATNRTTELYINLADHPQLDPLGFTPIATVIEGGMSVVERFHSGYGELSDACDLHGFRPCDGPLESRVLSDGNAYLDRDFPRLTQIHGVAIVEEQDDNDASGGRVELHVHLDGSIPVSTLLRIARARRLSLPGLPGGKPPKPAAGPKYRFSGFLAGSQHQSFRYAR